MLLIEHVPFVVFGHGFAGIRLASKEKRYPRIARDDQLIFAIGALLDIDEMTVDSCEVLKKRHAEHDKEKIGESHTSQPRHDLHGFAVRRLLPFYKNEHVRAGESLGIRKRRRVIRRFFWTVMIVGLAGCAGAALLPSSTMTPIAARDLGRRDTHKNVYVVVALRYRNEAELTNLVDDLGNPASPRFRQFLSPEQFDARYAPDRQVYQRVISVLHQAGFAIVRTYHDRALIDASTSTATAERFFDTRIHDFAQARHTAGYANVRPLRIPSAISAIVSSVELNSLVLATDAAMLVSPLADAASKNVVVNGGFEDRMKSWQACGNVAPHIVAIHPFAGHFDALVGSLTKADGSVKGLAAICQRVKIPDDAALDVYTYSVTNVHTAAGGFQEIGFMDDRHHVVATLYHTLLNDAHWLHRSWRLPKELTGRSLYLFFGVDGHGQKNLYDTMFVDNVALIGDRVGPSPSPTPVGPGPGKPLTGPLYGPSNGWAPRSVADGFDLPVQHGYNGHGITAAIIAQGAPNKGDLDTFFAGNHIARYGKIVSVPVAGGPGNADPTEATMDLETLGALAPAARILVYETPDLSNQSLEDAYNQVLSDAKVTVVESPFGECEIADSAFTQESEKAAIAAAAIGMTFVAASGDQGSSCFNGTTNIIGAEAPGSDPHVVAVGGTESVAPALAKQMPCPCPISTPIAWDDHNVAFGGLSGGGISQEWSLPPYQRRLTGSPELSTTHRNVPDIAFPAVDDDLFIHDASEIVDGTSWSASIATALLTETAQICGRLGYVNPAIYDVYAKYGEGTELFDVTSGFNGRYAPALSRGFHAAPGYDNVTGLGMPNGIRFSVALCGRSLADDRLRSLLQ